MTREEAKQVLRHIIQVADTSDCGIKEIDGTDEEALEMAIKALEIEPCDDAVSREVFEQVVCERDIAIEQLNELGYEFGEKIDQEPKTGHWIAHSDGIWIKHYECSECGKVHDTYSDYCPNCGAKMSES